MKILLPFSWLYSGAMWLRNRAFDAGMLKTAQVSVPVISVGNLSVGGTGKTPLVEYLVKRLLAEGKVPAVVSRGYKRKSKGVVVVSDGKRTLVSAEEGGDEPVQMARKFPEALVVVGERRADAARKAVELGAKAIVLDDGFQHRYLKRDVNILVVDASSDSGKDAVLPAGMLRESIAGARRADLVVLTNMAPGDSAEEKLRPLRPYYGGDVVASRRRITEARRVGDNGSASVDVVRTMRLMAFSGIGNHDGFIRELAAQGFDVVSNLGFSDHHQYTEMDVSMLAAFGKSMEIDAFVTTEKDAVRLSANRGVLDKLLAQFTVFFLRIELEILEGQSILQSRIDTLFGGTVHHENWNH